MRGTSISGNGCCRLPSHCLRLKFCNSMAPIAVAAAPLNARSPRNRAPPADASKSTIETVCAAMSSANDAATRTSTSFSVRSSISIGKRPPSVETLLRRSAIWSNIHSGICARCHTTVVSVSWIPSTSAASFRLLARCAAASAPSTAGCPPPSIDRAPPQSTVNISSPTVPLVCSISRQLSWRTEMPGLGKNCHSKSPSISMV